MHLQIKCMFRINHDYCIVNGTYGCLGFEVKDLCVPHDDIHCLIMWS